VFMSLVLWANLAEWGRWYSIDQWGT
jgi:hypothetical protein